MRYSMNVSLSSRAVATTVIAGLVAVAAWLGMVPLVAFLAVFVLLMAQGWPAVTGQPSHSGTAIVVTAAGLMALLAAWRSEVTAVMQYVPLVLGVSVGMAFLAEMLRRDNRERLLSSLSATVLGAFIATGMAGWVAATRAGIGYRPALVVVGALTVVIAAALCAFHIRPGWLAFVVTIWLVAAIGLVLGLVVPEVGWSVGLVVGAVLGIAVAVLRMLLGDEARLFDLRAAMSAAVVPVAVGGILLYALHWLPTPLG